MNPFAASTRLLKIHAPDWPCFYPSIAESCKQYQQQPFASPFHRECFVIMKEYIIPQMKHNT